MTRLATLVTLTLILLASALAATAQTGNLLVNPDAETGGISGWTDAPGNGFDVYAGQFPTTPVQSGSYSFWGGINGPPAGRSNEIRQDVDVSSFAAAIDAGAVTAYFSGYGRSNSASGQTDNGRITVEYRNGVGGVLQSYDTGNITPVNTYVFKQDTRVVPVGTRTIRVRLRGTRSVGSSTDAFFDSLSVSLVGVPTATEDETWGAIKGLYH